MNYEKCKDRYLNDPEFHIATDLFYQLRFERKLTISELKDALLYACIRFESDHIKPIIMNREEANFI